MLGVLNICSSINSTEEMLSNYSAHLVNTEQEQTQSRRLEDGGRERLPKAPIQGWCRGCTVASLGWTVTTGAGMQD